MEQTTAIEKALITGDLAKLDLDSRYEYYNDVCKSLGLNPLTRPFDFITLNGKLQLYAKKDATDQLRRIYQVSVTDLKHSHNKDLELYVVTAVGQNGQGRLDAATGAVTIKGLAGDNLANAIMKSESKAKRRLTLSLCGLGMLLEEEIETVPEQMLTIKDGLVEVPANVVIPEPKPKKEKAKKEIPSVEVAPLVPAKATDFLFGQNELEKAPSGNNSPETDGKAENVPVQELSKIDDTDLPSNLNPDTLPTPEELKKIGATVKALVEQPKMNLLGKYLKRTFKKDSTKELTSKEWQVTIEALEVAKKENKLDELLAEVKA